MKATSAEGCEFNASDAKHRTRIDEFDLRDLWLTLAELFERVEKLEPISLASNDARAMLGIPELPRKEPGDGE